MQASEELHWSNDRIRDGNEGYFFRRSNTSAKSLGKNHYQRRIPEKSYWIQKPEEENKQYARSELNLQRTKTLPHLIKNRNNDNQNIPRSVSFKTSSYENERKKHNLSNSAPSNFSCDINERSVEQDKSPYMNKYTFNAPLSYSQDTIQGSISMYRPNKSLPRTYNQPKHLKSHGASVHLPEQFAPVYSRPFYGQRRLPREGMYPLHQIKRTSSEPTTRNFTYGITTVLPDDMSRYNERYPVQQNNLSRFPQRLSSNARSLSPGQLHVTFNTLKGSNHGASLAGASRRSRYDQWSEKPHIHRHSRSVSLNSTKGRTNHEDANHKHIHRSRSLDGYSTTLETWDKRPGIVSFNQKSRQDDIFPLRRSTSAEKIAERAKVSQNRQGGMLQRKISVNGFDGLRKVEKKTRHTDINNSQVLNSEHKLALVRDAKKPPPYPKVRTMSPVSSGYESDNKCRNDLIKRQSRQHHYNYTPPLPRIKIENEVNDEKKIWDSADYKGWGSFNRSASWSPNRNGNLQDRIGINIHNKLIPVKNYGMRLEQEISLDGIPLSNKNIKDNGKMHTNGAKRVKNSKPRVLIENQIHESSLQKAAEKARTPVRRTRLRHQLNTNDSGQTYGYLTDDITQESKHILNAHSNGYNTDASSSSDVKRFSFGMGECLPNSTARQVVYV